MSPAEQTSTADRLNDPRAKAWQDTPPPAEFLRGHAPLIETHEVPQCAVCGQASYEPLTIGFDYELRTCRNPWRVVRCTNCGHVWLNPRPAIDSLPVIYPPHYYAYNFEQDVHPIAVWGKRRLDEAKLRGICRQAGTPQTYLDVGCGQGRYLDAMATMGLDRQQIYGLELDGRVVRQLAERGYRAIEGRVETCTEIEPASIGLATMFHVIEHVADPGLVIDRLADWLVPGGMLALETPNVQSLDARLFADRWWGGYHFPRHWHLFTPASLTRLLSERGLQVVSLRYQTGHSFWMFSLHHRLRYGPRPRPRLARWFDPFQSLGPLMGFTAFDLLRARLGFRTSAMLVLARRAA